MAPTWLLATSNPIRLYIAAYKVGAAPHPAAATFSPHSDGEREDYTSGFSHIHTEPPIRPRKISQPTWLFDLNSLRH